MKGDDGSLLSVKAKADLAIDLAIDLTDPTDPSFYILDTSGIAVGAWLSVDPLNLDLSIGPLGLFVHDGTGTLDDGSGLPDGFATWTVSLKDDYKIGDTFDLSLFETKLVGAVNLDLPIDFPTRGVPLDPNVPSLLVKIPDLGKFFAEPGASNAAITLPDFATAFGDVFSNLQYLSSLALSWDGFFSVVEEVADGDVFGVPIPLIGNELAEGSQFILQLRDRVTAELENLQDSSITAIKQAFYNALGPGGLKWLQDIAGGAGGQSDGFITLADIVADTSVAGQVLFEIQLHQDAIALDVPLDFDIGIPGLQLDVDGGVQVRMGFDAALKFGIQTDLVGGDLGFFLDTSDPEEFTFYVDARIPGMNARGQLAFLQLDVQDDPLQPTSLGLTFSVDLQDPNHDGMLTLSEIAAADFGEIIDARVNGGADVNLKLLASFGGNANFPSIRSDFHLAWDFLDASTGAGFEDFGGEPADRVQQCPAESGRVLREFRCTDSAAQSRTCWILLKPWSTCCSIRFR